MNIGSLNIMAEAMFNFGSCERTTGPSRRIMIYGHSFPVKLRELCHRRGVSAEQLFQRQFDLVDLKGHPGLFYDRIFDSCDHYLAPLLNHNLDILCIDLGANDLCFHNVTPSTLEHFLWMLQTYRIRPRIIVFLTVLKRTYLGHYPGQISDLQMYNARVTEFNQLLRTAMAPKGPTVQVWSQEAINRAPFLDGCHLTRAGELQQVRGLIDMMNTMGQLLNRMAP